jgi:hypothetical protein
MYLYSYSYSIQKYNLSFTRVDDVAIANKNIEGGSTLGKDKIYFMLRYTYISSQLS